jgi:hypothetical protein
MKVEFVFSLDEVGMSEWEDQKDKKVIIVKKMDPQMINHRASRNMRHLAIMTCIITVGKSLPPYIVKSQDSEPFRKRQMRHRFPVGFDFVVRS